MVNKTTISYLCDECEKELRVDSLYPAHYGLVLSAQDFGFNTGSTVYAVNVFPPIDREYHFCGLGCLGKWINKRIHDVVPEPEPTGEV